MTAVVDLVESAREQGSARQQHHGQGELAHDEEVAEASMAAITGGAAPSALERADQVEPVDEVRGGDAESKGREEAGTEHPAENAPVETEIDADPVPPGLRAHDREPVEGPQGDEKGAGAPGEREEKGLDDERAQACRGWAGPPCR